MRFETLHILNFEHMKNYVLRTINNLLKVVPFNITSQIIYEVGTKVTRDFHTLQASMKYSLLSLLHYSEHSISILGSRYK